MISTVVQLDNGLDTQRLAIFNFGANCLIRKTIGGVDYTQNTTVVGSIQKAVIATNNAGARSGVGTVTNSGVLAGTIGTGTNTLRIGAAIAGAYLNSTVQKVQWFTTQLTLSECAAFTK